MDIGIAILLIGAGLVAGFLIAKSITGTAGDTQDLQKKIDELKEEHHSYQESVNLHFTRTADLIDKLNTNYNEIQAHLVQGAEMLVAPEYRLEAEHTDADEPMKKESPGAEPPRDYAPKEPDQEGTLSESYGLKVEQLTEAKS